MIKVSPFVVQAEGTTQLLISRVGDFEVWFRVPADHAVSGSGAALASAALLPAMTSGEGLALPPELPLDMVFLENLERLQGIYLAWQEPLGLKLERIAVDATVTAPVGPANAGTMSFFSGGVDGTYTAMRQRNRITRAVLLRGIDMQLTNVELWEAANSAALRLAAHFELPLLAVETNIRFLGYHYGLKWASHYQGAGLAAIAHLLGFKETLVAATNSLAELTPYGSHPLTDPLWSSGTTRLIHEGTVKRVDKIAAIGSDPAVMEVLRVCWHDSGYNCGHCGKCLRTRAALELLGIDAPTFSGCLDWEEFGRIRLGDPSEWDNFEGLEMLERDRPNPEARRALRKIRRASLRRTGLRDLDASFGAPLKWLKDRLAGK